MIARPAEGQRVWMLVSGKPIPYYFKEMRGQGACTVTFKPDGKDPVYMEQSRFFSDELEATLSMIDSAFRRTNEALREIGEWINRIEELCIERSSGSYIFVGSYEFEEVAYHVFEFDGDFAFMDMSSDNLELVKGYLTLRAAREGAEQDAKRKQAQRESKALVEPCTGRS